RLPLEPVQYARGSTHASVGKPGIEGRRLQLFAGFQAVAKVKGIEAAGNTHLLPRRLLHSDAPAAAPAQRSEPDWSVFFCGLIRAVDRKPRVRLVRGAAAAALDDVRSSLQRFGMQLPL